MSRFTLITRIAVLLPLAAMACGLQVVVSSVGSSLPGTGAPVQRGALLPADVLHSCVISATLSTPASSVVAGAAIAATVDVDSLSPCSGLMIEILTQASPQAPLAVAHSWIPPAKESILRPFTPASYGMVRNGYLAFPALIAGPQPAVYQASLSIPVAAPNTAGVMRLTAELGYGTTPVLATNSIQTTVTSPPPAPAPPAPASTAGPGRYYNRLVSSNGALNVPVGYYTDCAGQTPLSHYGVSIDTCVKHNLYFVGHNPGPFTPIVSMPIGTIITYWNPSGVPERWVVAQRIEVAFDNGEDPAFFDQPYPVTFQTCATLNQQWDWLVDLTIAN